MLMLGGGLPTASSVNAEAGSSGLVVDIHTGKTTIKKVNTKSRPDNASTRSLKSFKMDANDRVSHDQVSHDQVSHDQVSNNLSVHSQASGSEAEDNSLLANLDNVDKPAVEKSKNLNLP